MSTLTREDVHRPSAEEFDLQACHPIPGWPELGGPYEHSPVSP